MTGYRLTPRAEADLVSPAVHTQETWGAAQEERYVRQMFARLDWLAENPRLERERDDIAPGYRSFPEGRHVIFYLICGDFIDVIGIPHGSRDLLNHFED
jgi:toxin ParE1/3/4